MFSGLFQGCFKTYRGRVYPKGYHLYKRASADELSKLCTCLDSNIELTKRKYVLQ